MADGFKAVAITETAPVPNRVVPLPPVAQADAYSLSSAVSCCPLCSSFDPAAIIIEGFFNRRGSDKSMFGSKSYKPRYFKLRSGFFSYHLDPTAESEGLIPIAGSAFKDGAKANECEISYGKSDIQAYNLSCGTTSLKETWKKALASVGTKMV